MKKVLLFILLIIIGIFAWFSLPKIKFIDNEQALEKGEVYKAEDFVESSNGIVIPEDTYLPTDSVGINYFHYSVKKAIFEVDCIFAYEVVDTTPPTITFKDKYIYKKYNEAYPYEKILENIIVDEGEIEIDSKYNPSISGVHIINVYAKDEFNNSSSAYFEVEVEDIEAPIVFVSGDNAKKYWLDMLG